MILKFSPCIDITSPIASWAGATGPTTDPVPVVVLSIGDAAILHVIG
jgi:hypothetical protein